MNRIGWAIAALTLAGYLWLAHASMQQRGYTPQQVTALNELVERAMKPKLVKPVSEAERVRLIASIFNEGR